MNLAKGIIFSELFQCVRLNFGTLFPSEVRTSETVDLFKKRHKTHYFKLAFDTS